MNTVNAPTLSQIKIAVRNIIATFRGFYTLSDNEVKLEELTTKDNNYIIRGRYDFTPLFGTKTEEGTFEITLNEKLNPVYSKVVPRSNVNANNRQ